MDLFAGCGGLSDGFESVGEYEGVAHVEWEKSASATLRQRLMSKWNVPDADQKVVRFDIQRTAELIDGWDEDKANGYSEGRGLARLVNASRNCRVDLIIGGPPCQAYSVAGRVRDEHGMQFDYRNYLFESYLQVVAKFQPDVFVFENVPGMLSAAPGGRPIAGRIRRAFGGIDYELLPDLNDALFDFTAFGVPQNRVRVIMVGLRRKSFGVKTQALLDRFYGDGMAKFRVRKPTTARQAIGDLPRFVPAPSEYKVEGKRFSHTPHRNGVANHIPRFHSSRDIETFRILTRDLRSGAGRYLSVDALKSLYTKRTGKVSAVHKYYVIRPNEPSNTIPAHLYKDGLRHIHWDPGQARSLTVREAARLQTFDDDFGFEGPMGEQYKMIGNAVPPRFGRSLALALMPVLAARRLH
jgi:DNA (cytosine-5)-methyltransferase 1